MQLNQVDKKEEEVKRGNVNKNISYEKQMLFIAIFLLLHPIAFA